MEGIVSAMVFGSVCLSPSVDNHTKDWTDIDRQSFTRAHKRCGEKFPKSPCLVKFIKKDFQVYNAVCGQRRFVDDSLRRR